MEHFNSQSLTSEERALLRAIAGAATATLARRAQIILGWDEGLEPDGIARRVGLTERTVKKWLQAFSEIGLAIFPDDVLAAVRTETREEFEIEAEAEPQLSITELCSRYHVNMAHARHVGQLAVELFDLTQPLHRLEPHYRDITFYAGLLHNVAFAGGVRDHHTRGRDIILANPLSDLADEDRNLIAISAVFHRKRWKEGRLEKEPSYQALSSALKPVAEWLSALVRIADGLDYAHSQATLIVNAQIDPAGVHVEVDGPFVEIDAGRADGKADMWSAVTNIPIRITPPVDSLIEIEGQAEEGSPPEPQRPDIQPDDPMSEAGRKILHFHLRRMLYHEPGTREGADIEALHDMRVATRRMRATLRVFGPYFGKKDRRWVSKGLRATARALGRVRDLDVQIAHAQIYLATLPPERQHELDQLFEHWFNRREKARMKLLAHLDSQEHTDFVADFTTFGEVPEMSSTEIAAIEPVCVKHVAPRLVYTRYGTVRAYGAVLEDAPIETLHALRIENKRLRYTLEFFSSVLGPEAEDVITLTVRAQDHLGALNDADVAGSLLRKYVKRVQKAARKQGEHLSEPESSSEFQGATAYLESRERELDHLRVTFPELWQELVSPDTRRKLALAVSVL